MKDDRVDREREEREQARAFLKEMKERNPSADWDYIAFLVNSGDDAEEKAAHERYLREQSGVDRYPDGVYDLD